MRIAKALAGLMLAATLAGVPAAGAGTPGLAALAPAAAWAAEDSGAPTPDGTDAPVEAVPISATLDDADNTDAPNADGAADNAPSDGGPENAGEDDGAQPADPDNLVNPRQTPDSSFLYDTLISDLEKADSYLDGQTVQITGEAVGDRINAEGDARHCWLVVEAVDGSYAEVSVYAPRSITEDIDMYGAYGKRGTTVQIRGTFNLTCPQHEGLSDLHADSLSIVSPGVEKPSALDPMKFAPGFFLVSVGVVLMLVFWRMRESRR